MIGCAVSAGLAITTVFDGGDRLRPSPPGWRSPRCSTVVIGCARLRRAGDHH
ncbi:hypothetical protein BZL30_0444 [Mycobacterium kansasii]|uniref:Uncharacterized protein n=1 Tax=Mycobacterium kansasii TaxID=1768 RepID=A0A1V3XRQ1_MYCKA|nr:hypothetical protein BZL30_0444 [Mycobacterium kansasii]